MKLKKVPGRVPPDAAATEAEITAAVEGLSDADRVRLQKFARVRLRGVPPAQLKARDWQELVGEAITKTLEGNRRWRKTVPFVSHLLGVIRSTADHWVKGANPDPAIPASQLAGAGVDGEIEDPLEASSGAPSQERVQIAKETLGRLRDHFADDDLVILLIDGFAEDYTASELPGILGVSANECHAALKRLRRYGDQLFSNGGAR